MFRQAKHRTFRANANRLRKFNLPTKIETRSNAHIVNISPILSLCSLFSTEAIAGFLTEKILIIIKFGLLSLTFNSKLITLYIYIFKFSPNFDSMHNIFS